MRFPHAPATPRFFKQCRSAVGPVALGHLSVRRGRAAGGCQALTEYAYASV